MIEVGMGNDHQGDVGRRPPQFAERGRDDLSRTRRANVEEQDTPPIDGKVGAAATRTHPVKAGRDLFHKAAGHARKPATRAFDAVH
jgi:hypothetical protein